MNPELEQMLARFREKSVPSVITLVGSTKFAWAFEEMYARFTIAGLIVLSVGCFGHAIGLMDTLETTELKAHLDALHLKKIFLSQFVFVIDVDGYIGASAQREIAYAKEQQKRIFYFSEDFPDFTEADCRYSLSALRKRGAI